MNDETLTKTKQSVVVVIDVYYNEDFLVQYLKINKIIKGNYFNKNKNLYAINVQNKHGKEKKTTGDGF